MAAEAKPCTLPYSKQWLDAKPLILPWVLVENKKAAKRRQQRQAVIDYDFDEKTAEEIVKSILSPRRLFDRERVDVFKWEQQHPHNDEYIQHPHDTIVRHSPLKPKLGQQALDKHFHTATLCASVNDCWISPRKKFDHFIWEVSWRTPQDPWLPHSRMDFRIGFVAAAIQDFTGHLSATKPLHVAVHVHVAKDKQGGDVGKDTIDVYAEGETICLKWKSEDPDKKMDHKYGDLYALKFDWEHKVVIFLYNDKPITVIYKNIDVENFRVLPAISIKTPRSYFHQNEKCRYASVVKCTQWRHVYGSIDAQQ